MCVSVIKYLTTDLQIVENNIAQMMFTEQSNSILRYNGGDYMDDSPFLNTRLQHVEKSLQDIRDHACQPVMIMISEVASNQSQFTHRHKKLARFCLT